MSGRNLSHCQSGTRAQDRLLLRPPLFEPRKARKPLKTRYFRNLNVQQLASWVICSTRHHMWTLLFVCTLVIAFSMACQKTGATKHIMDVRADQDSPGVTEDHSPSCYFERVSRFQKAGRFEPQFMVFRGEGTCETGFSECYGDVILSTGMHERVSKGWIRVHRCAGVDFLKPVRWGDRLYLVEYSEQPSFLAMLGNGRLNRIEESPFWVAKIEEPLCWGRMPVLDLPEGWFVKTPDDMDLDWPPREEARHEGMYTYRLPSQPNPSEDNKPIY